VFHYEGIGDDDEAGHRFAAHAFKPGEYVSIRDHHNVIHTFKVVSVEPTTNVRPAARQAIAAPKH
jgi:hypothetical protein